MAGVSTILSEWLLVILIIVSLVLEFVLHRIEHWISHRHHHLKTVVSVLYRELMILGIVSFTFIMYVTIAVPEKEVVHSFEFAHIFIFLLAVFYTAVVLTSMFTSLRLSARWKRMEKIDLVKYLHLKDQYTRLRLRIHKHRGVFWRRFQWWFPNFLTLWKYWQLHEVMAFHDIRFQFIFYRNLPEHFRFSSFLRRIKSVTFVELVESHWTLYIIFLVIVLGDILRRVLIDDPSKKYKPDTVESAFIIGASVLLTVLVQVLASKIRKIYWELTKNPRIYYEGVEPAAVEKELEAAASRRMAAREIRRRSKTGDTESDSIPMSDSENDADSEWDVSRGKIQPPEAEMLSAMHTPRMTKPLGSPNPAKASHVLSPEDVKIEIGPSDDSDNEAIARVPRTITNPDGTNTTLPAMQTLPSAVNPGDNEDSEIEEVAARHSLDLNAHRHGPARRAASSLEYSRPDASRARSSLEYSRPDASRARSSLEYNRPGASRARSSLEYNRPGSEQKRSLSNDVEPTSRGSTQDVAIPIEVDDIVDRHSLDLSRHPNKKDAPSRPASVARKASVAMAAVEAARRRPSNAERQFGRHSLDSQTPAEGQRAVTNPSMRRIGSPRILSKLSSRGVPSDDEHHMSGSDYGRGSLEGRQKHSIELAAAMPRDELAIRHHGQGGHDIEAGVQHRVQEDQRFADPTSGSSHATRLMMGSSVHPSEDPTEESGEEGSGYMHGNKGDPADGMDSIMRHKSLRYMNATILKNLEHAEVAKQMEPNPNYHWLLLKVAPRLARVASPVEKLFWFGSHHFFFWCVEFTLFFSTVLLAAASASVFLISIEDKRKWTSWNVASICLAPMALLFVLFRIAGIIKKYIFILHNASLVPESLAIRAIHTVNKKKMDFGGDDGESDLSGSETEREDGESALERRKTLGRFFRSEAESGNMPGIEAAAAARRRSTESSGGKLNLRKRTVLRRQSRMEAGRDSIPEIPESRLGDRAY